MTQTGTKPDATKIEFEDLYDWFMLQVEPELTTLILPNLDELYSEETPEEHTKRAGKYAEAFTKVEQMLGNFYSTLGGELTRLRKMCHALSEKQASTKETTTMNVISTQLDAA